MKVKIAKWGNSLALRLPKRLADDLGLAAGAVVDLEKDGSRLAIETAPGRKIPRYRLEDLLAEMDRLGPENEPELVDWGPDRGAEIIDDEYGRGSFTPPRGGSGMGSTGPTRGREQGGERPAVVLSDREFHRRSRLAIVCLITSNRRPWPMKVSLPEGLAAGGSILVDQIRALDRKERGFRRIGKIPDEVLANVRAKLATLVGIDTGRDR